MIFRLSYFILIVFIPFNNLFCQKEIDSSYLYCKYEMSFVTDTLNESTRNYENGILLIGDKVSLFRSHVKFQSDSLRESIAERAFVTSNPSVLDGLKNIARPKFLSEVYNKNGTIKIYSKIFIDNYVFESTRKVDWEITNETKEISTYKCRKAIGYYGKRKFTAWFTSEIPIPEGPYNFKGLPGLIVELYDKNKNYHFLLKQVLNKKMIFKLEKNAIQTTFEKFISKRKEYLKDPSGLLGSRASSNLRSMMTKEKKDEYDQREKRVNNYLEY